MLARCSVEIRVTKTIRKHEKQYAGWQELYKIMDKEVQNWVARMILSSQLTRWRIKNEVHPTFKVVVLVGAIWAHGQWWIFFIRGGFLCILQYAQAYYKKICRSLCLPKVIMLRMWTHLFFVLANTHAHTVGGRKNAERHCVCCEESFAPGKVTYWFLLP